MEEINQSIEKTQDETEKTAQKSPEQPAESRPRSKAGYRNRTARMMRAVSVVMLVLTAAFFAFQIYMLVVAGVQQGFMLSILYNAPSLMLFLLLFLGVSFLFRFFAEVLELMDRRP